MITAVVDGIVATALTGAELGTDDPGMITGLLGIDLTTTYEDDGKFDGIDCFVTNGVVKIVE